MKRVTYSILPMNTEQSIVDSVSIYTVFSDSRFWARTKISKHKQSLSAYLHLTFVQTSDLVWNRIEEKQIEKDVEEK